MKMIVVLPFDDSGHVIGRHEIPSDGPYEGPDANESESKVDKVSPINNGI